MHNNINNNNNSTTNINNTNDELKASPPLLGFIIISYRFYEKIQVDIRLCARQKFPTKVIPASINKNTI